MSHLREACEDGNTEFSWGQKKEVGQISKSIQYYESFTYDGVEYFLYDSVYMWREGAVKPYIGKLVKIWETRSREKKVKSVWYFHPNEVAHWSRGIEFKENEILLSSGEGEGVFNINLLEAISGKCNVVCTSKDTRNPQASTEDRRAADYVFSRTFNVATCKISDNFPDMIAGVRVEHFFNRRKDKKLIFYPKLKGNLEEGQRKLISSSKVETDMAVRAVRDLGRSKLPYGTELKLPTSSLHRQTCSSDKEKVGCPDDHLSARVPDLRPVTKRKFPDTPVDLKEDLGIPPGHMRRSRSVEENLQGTKASKIHEEQAGAVEKHKGIKDKTQNMEFARRPKVDSSKWFKQQTWEEKMQKADQIGSLVLLENLDPSITSSEVEDIVWHAFDRRVSAKMIQRSTFPSPYYGKALVIFKSKVDADFSIAELNKKCLMLGDGRPVVGRRPSIKEPGNPCKFFGHLVIDKRLQKQRTDTKNAVSTSHYSQSNTIEFDMAMEWRVLQEKSKRWWCALNKQQAKEIADLKGQLKAQ